MTEEAEVLTIGSAIGASQELKLPRAQLKARRHNAIEIKVHGFQKVARWAKGLAVPQLGGTAMGERDAMVCVPAGGVKQAPADGAMTTAAQVNGYTLRRGKAAGHVSSSSRMWSM